MLLNSGQVLTERAKICPRAEAVVDVATGVRLDFRQLNERANQVANALLALNFRPGERIACLMSNQSQYVESYYACAKAGLVFVALNWRLTVPELSFQVMDCGATAVIYGADQQPLVEPLRAQFPHVRWLAADAGDYASTVSQASPLEPPVGATGEDPLFMMYTSGTTGRPKGALMSHRANIAWLASMLATSDLRHGERTIIVAPLFHIAGLGLVMSAVYRGMTSVLLKQFDPARMWDLVDAEHITGFFAVPAMLALMHQHPKCATRDPTLVALGAVRCRSGAGAVDRGLHVARGRGAAGVRPHRNARRHLPDVAGTCAVEGRLDRHAVLRHRRASRRQGRQPRATGHSG